MVIPVMYPGSNHGEYSNNIQFHKMMHVQTSLPTLEDYIAGPYNKLQFIWLQYSVYIHK